MRLVATIALAAAIGTLPVPASAQAAWSEPPHDKAQTLLDEGRATEAEELLRVWVKKNGRDPRARLLLSTALFLRGDTVGGEAELERALELDPELRQGWLNRGALALAEADYDGALAAFERAEAIDPEADENSLNIGAVLLLKGELSRATERFRLYLERHPTSAEAYYLVASNYAMTGFVQPALQALGYAIRLDEKSRRRARIDPNFSDVARDQRFQELLATDAWSPPAGSWTAEQELEAGFTGPDSRVLKAALRAFEVLGEPFDRQVEVADEWALVWGDRFRVKLQKRELAKTRIQLTSLPGVFEEAEWRRVSEGYLRAVTIELLKLLKSASPGEAGPPSSG